jgi:hypothetical protein
MKLLDSTDSRWLGPGALPERIGSSGTVEMVLGSRSAVLYRQCLET